MGSRNPLRVLPLTPTHRRLRLEWCRAQGNWTVAEWNQVIFSDESRFNLSSDDNRVRVWRPPGERLNPAFALQQHTAGAIFQQDIAWLRTARVSQGCLRTVTNLPWRAISSDLSQMEHIWDHLGRRVGHAISLNELEARLQKITLGVVREHPLCLPIPPTSRGDLRLFKKNPCREGTIHLQASMSSPGFKLRPNSTTVSVTNHYTGWAKESGVHEVFFKQLNLFINGMQWFKVILDLA
ncbi:transposable element Tcb2 transposase [Trichonephila clavipes]|nr:transposable element Tcb2 transposase [Trichonephila clavipes]